MINYNKKYLKYKLKYLYLKKNIYGGMKRARDSPKPSLDDSFNVDILNKQDRLDFESYFNEPEQAQAQRQAEEQQLAQAEEQQLTQAEEQPLAQPLAQLPLLDQIESALLHIQKIDRIQQEQARAVQQAYITLAQLQKTHIIQAQQYAQIQQIAQKIPMPLTEIEEEALELIKEQEEEAQKRTRQLKQIRQKQKKRNNII